MITLVKFICLFLYEQVKNAFIEVVRINETVVITDEITQKDIDAMLEQANIHGALVIASTAITIATVVYLFVYGFYDEIAIEIEGEETTMRKFRKTALILIVISTLVDLLTRVI